MCILKVYYWNIHSNHKLDDTYKNSDAIEYKNYFVQGKN